MQTTRRVFQNLHASIFITLSLSKIVRVRIFEVMRLLLNNRTDICFSDTELLEYARFKFAQVRDNTEHM